MNDMFEAREHLPTVMPTSNRPANLGSSVNDDTSRLDGVAKVTGRAKYGRDLYPDGGLFVAFVRCPYGAAKLESFDEAAAKAVPGVLEVTIEGDEGSWNGQNLGYVVAETPAALRRGLSALACTWKREPVKTTIADGAGSAPEPGEDAQRILESADVVVSATYTTPVQTHSSLETHGASIDFRGEDAVAYVSTQGTSAARDGLGEALGLPESRFEVVCEYVGGGFGSKLNGAGKEGVTAARVAAKYKRPAYLFVNRAEDHLDTGNRPSSVTRVRIGATRDGRILGGQIRTWGGVGVSRRGGGVAIPSGRYELGKVEQGHEDVQLNAGAPRPFRAPGHPQAAFAEELMLDEVATAIGMDPLELRIKLDTSEDRREMYRRGAELIGWSDRRPTGAQTGVVRTGYGAGSTDWGRFPARAEAEVIIHRDGSVEARTGTQDIGTGMRTLTGALVADGIGVPLSEVEVRIGRSSLPPGPGSGGSMTSHNTAPAIMMAAVGARDALLEAVAARTGHGASELDIVGGEIVRGDATIMSWREACGLVPGDHVAARGARDDASLERFGGEGHSQGVQLVRLDVDTETGVIHVRHVVAIQACGRVVFRKGAESQIIGGVIQGLSYALFENKILDRNTGTMVNPNLEWYKILGTDDMPHVEPVLWTKGQTGVRSLGEPPTIPTAGATACALFNALGVPVRDLPLTPDRVLGALEGGAA